MNSTAVNGPVGDPAVMPINTLSVGPATQSPSPSSQEGGPREAEKAKSNEPSLGDHYADHTVVEEVRTANQMSESLQGLRNLAESRNTVWTLKDGFLLYKDCMVVPQDDPTLVA